MEVFVSLSAKRLGDLYHYTSVESLLSILSSGSLTLSSGRAQGSEESYQGKYSYFLSFTRSRTGSYHASKKDAVMLTFDGDRLSSKYKFTSVDYWGGRNHKVKSESEERLLSDQIELPILGYLKRVDIISSGAKANANVAPLKFDPSNPGFGLVRIESYLKRNKIPYAFYPDMKSWILRRGQYTPTVEKNVGKIKRKVASKMSYKLLNDMLSALQGPLENASRDAREICKEVSMGLGSASMGMWMNEYQTAVYPEGIHSALRQVGIKISKTLKHLGLRTKEDIEAYLKDKYAAYELAQNMAGYVSKANAYAKMFARLLDSSISTSELTPVERRLISDPRMYDFDDHVSDVNFYLSKIPDLSKYSPQVKQIVTAFPDESKTIPAINGLRLAGKIGEIRGI